MRQHKSDSLQGGVLVLPLPQLNVVLSTSRATHNPPQQALLSNAQPHPTSSRRVRSQWASTHWHRLKSSLAVVRRVFSSRGVRVHPHGHRASVPCTPLNSTFDSHQLPARGSLRHDPHTARHVGLPTPVPPTPVAPTSPSGCATISNWSGNVSNVASAGIAGTVGGEAHSPTWSVMAVGGPDGTVMKQEEQQPSSPNHVDTAAQGVDVWLKDMQATDFANLEAQYRILTSQTSAHPVTTVPAHEAQSPNSDNQREQQSQAPQVIDAAYRRHQDGVVPGSTKIGMAYNDHFWSRFPAQ